MADIGDSIKQNAFAVRLIMAGNFDSKYDTISECPLKLDRVDVYHSLHKLFVLAQAGFFA